LRWRRLAFLVALRIADPRIVATIRLRGFDLEQQLAPRPYQPSPVRIVAIDDKSLKQVGQSWVSIKDEVSEQSSQTSTGPTSWRKAPRTMIVES
jgi:CHASE2 domain-containing sensor protein